jgi:anti-sigma regulatory factor (Ser/Thr protein kinase)
MRDNFCILYAAAMCFSPELQEDFLKVLLHFTSQQREIEDSTSGIAEMLRFIATHGRKLEYDGIIFVQ